MKIALIGQPGSGRTTLFKALAANPSADSSKPLTVSVPDPRVDFLAEIWKPRSIIYSQVIFEDIHSPVFSSRQLAICRNSTALALVLDNFARGNLCQDFSTAESELIFADLEIVDRKLSRLKKEGRLNSREYLMLKKLRNHLEEGNPLRILKITKNEELLLSPYALLTFKPLFVISNRADNPVEDETSLLNLAEKTKSPVIPVNAGFELELAELPVEERREFLESEGYCGSGLERLLKSAFSSLDLLVFFTVGPEEVHARPLKNMSTALEAAGKIHSDMARGFIRAQVASFSDFKKTPDYRELKSLGKLKLEGKDYEVQDGDIIEIRFNV